MTYQSPVLPSLAPLRARLLNALTTRVLPLDFAADAGTDTPALCRLELNCAAASSAEEAPFSAACRLFFKSGEALWKVEMSSLDALTLRPELAQWSSEQPLGALPEALRLAVLERLFAPALAAAARHCGCEASFASEDAVKTAAALSWSEALPFILTLPSGKSAGSMVDLRISWSDDEAARFLLGTLEASPVVIHPETMRLLPQSMLDCAVELGSMQLTPAEAAALRGGDVLLPQIWTPESPRLHIPSSGTLLCRLENSILTVMDRDAGTADSPDAASDANEVVMPEENAQERLLDQQALASMELPVTFELASIKMKVSEAAALRPGFTFALEGDASSVPVFIRIGGRIAAKGRLVDVGGMAGVQITGLSDGAQQTEAAEEGK